MESDAGSCDVFQLWCASMMRKGEKKMKMVFCFMLTMTLCLNCFAKDNVESNLPKAEVAAIASFFEEFREACNKKDVEKVKKLLGSNWDYWSCNIDNGIKFESIEVLDVVMDEAMKVSAIVSAVDRHGNRSSPKMVFTLTKRDEAYFIETIAVPEVEKRNAEQKKHAEEAFERTRLKYL